MLSHCSVTLILLPDVGLHEDVIRCVMQVPGGYQDSLSSNTELGRAVQDACDELDNLSSLVRPWAQPMWPWAFARQTLRRAHQHWNTAGEGLSYSSQRAATKARVQRQHYARYIQRR